MRRIDRAGAGDQGLGRPGALRLGKLEECRVALLRRALIVFPLLALAVVYGAAWLAPAVSLFHDDGIYLVTAKALAEGKGYRIASLPEEIPQTKFPFLFPAVLSVAWRAMPDFPRNAPLLKALPLAFALAWFVLSFRLIRRLGGTRLQALWITLLSAASPLVIFCSTSLMSETLFAALLAGALLAAAGVEQGDSDGRARSRNAWIAGLLAALAFLTRTVGIAALAGIPCGFALGRRFGAAARFLAAALPVAALWPLWVRAQTVAAPAQAFYSLENYASWNIIFNYTPGEKFRIFYSNALKALAAPGVLVGLPPSVWIALAVLILGAVFLRKLARPGAIELTVAAYLAVICCWTWPPPRFLAVLLPLILWFLWSAAQAMAASRPARIAAVAAAGLISCAALAVDLRSLAGTLRLGHFPINGIATDDWREMDKAFAWLRDNAPADAVVLANLDPAVYLYTGRKASRSVVASAYKLLYAPDSPEPDAVAALDEVLAASHATYLLVTPDLWFSEIPLLRRNIARYQAGHPGVLRLVERPGSDPAYQIYGIARQP